MKPVIFSLLSRGYSINWINEHTGISKELLYYYNKKHKIGEAEAVEIINRPQNEKLEEVTTK